MLERTRLGVSIFVTTRCNHRCGHCISSCRPGTGEDMPENIFRQVVENCARVGLVNSVVIAGGEPFIDSSSLLERLAFLLSGHGVLRVLVPTNGSWALRDDYLEISAVLAAFGDVLPLGLSVRLSENHWNLDQFGERREELLSRWAGLERRHSGVFGRKRLRPEKVIKAGSASGFSGPTQQRVYCAFDEWKAGALGGFTDYLSFWPDGSCRVCQSGGAVLGTFQDDYLALLDRRSGFLSSLRKNHERGVSATFCDRCSGLMREWQNRTKDRPC
jgi:hypothetical protein